MFAFKTSPLLEQAFTRASRLGGRKHRLSLRTGAMIVAIGLHLVLLLLFIPSMKGNALQLGEGVGTGPERVIDVSLSGLSGSQLPYVRHVKAPDPPKEDPMKALFRRLGSNEPSAFRTPEKPSRTDSSNPLDAFNPPPDNLNKPAQKASSTKTGDGGDGSNAGAARGAQDTPKKAQQVGGGDGAPSRGSFAAQVLACWQRLPGSSAIPVSLDVTLDGRGLLAKPPVIVRPAGAVLNTTRLIAEERAIRALAGCVPYKGVGIDGNTFRLDFQKSR